MDKKQEKVQVDDLFDFSDCHPTCAMCQKINDYFNESFEALKQNDK